MPRSFTIERENLPQVVQGWLRAWASGVSDTYDKAFRQIAGL